MLQIMFCVLFFLRRNDSLEIQMGLRPGDYRAFWRIDVLHDQMLTGENSLWRLGRELGIWHPKAILLVRIFQSKIFDHSSGV